MQATCSALVAAETCSTFTEDAATTAINPPPIPMTTEEMDYVFGMPDLATAQHQAVVALGNLVKRQALVMGFSDTFAVIGVVLLLAAIAMMMLRKVSTGAGGGGAH